MKNVSIFFLLAVAILLNIWFIFDKFKKKPNVIPPAIAIKQTVDSMLASQSLKDSIYYKDSLTAKKAVDSFSKKLVETNSLLNNERKKTLQLSKAVDDALLLNDTASYFEYCNGLSAQVKIQDNRIGDYIIQVDTLNKAKDSLQNLLSIKLVEKNNLVNNLFKSFSDMHNLYDSISLISNKQSKKLSKKYAIGLGVTGGITTIATPGAAVGITIQRIIIRL